ncbi:HOG (high osmolarity glycerol) pathway protein [Xanthoria calcicola]
MAPSPSPSPSPTQEAPSTDRPSMANLPSLNTNHLKQSTMQRPPPYARNRMSQYSTTFNTPQSSSRPGSYAFPHFHSSLEYALVRDFAYPIIHPYHYGPPPETSGLTSGTSTPASEYPRRLSDPSGKFWDNGNSHWAPGPWGGDGFIANDSSERLPQMAYGDGPPYSEDEDLHSPIIVSSRQKKLKSSGPGSSGGNGKGKARSPGQGEEDEDDYFQGRNEDPGETDKDARANGYHGNSVTHPPDEGTGSTLAPSRYTGQRDSHFQATLPNRSYRQEEDEASESSEDDQSQFQGNPNDSRYSKDYQFTIASPDEEMHGKAVALFDFARENENELPLAEGQVIWVSYRHGQGWLVAEDPKSGDKGLVPEEYVRLLRDIEGGWGSFGGDAATEQDLLSPMSAEPQSAVTPTQADPIPIQSSHIGNGNTNNNNNNNNGSDKRPPIVSTFSTSSKDLDPYPQHLLDKQAGQLPPQVVHYGSQANTPTLTSPMPFARGNSGDATLLGKESFARSEVESEDTETDDSDDDDQFHDSREQQKA